MNVFVSSAPLMRKNCSDAAATKQAAKIRDPKTIASTSIATVSGPQSMSLITRPITIVTSPTDSRASRRSVNSLVISWDSTGCGRRKNASRVPARTYVGRVSTCPTTMSAIDQDKFESPNRSSMASKSRPPSTLTLWKITYISANSVRPISSELAMSRANPVG